MSCGPCGACKSNATVWLVEVPAHDGDLVAMCMMAVGPRCGGCVCGRCVCDVYAWMPCRLGCHCLWLSPWGYATNGNKTVDFSFSRVAVR